MTNNDKYKINLIGELDETKTRKQINKDLKSLAGSIDKLKVKTEINEKQIGEQIGQSISENAKITESEINHVISVIINGVNKTKQALSGLNQADSLSKEITKTNDSSANLQSNITGLASAFNIFANSSTLTYMINTFNSFTEIIDKSSASLDALETIGLGAGLTGIATLVKNFA